MKWCKLLLISVEKSRKAMEIVLYRLKYYLKNVFPEFEHTTVVTLQW